MNLRKMVRGGLLLLCLCTLLAQAKRTSLRRAKMNLSTKIRTSAESFPKNVQRLPVKTKANTLRKSGTARDNGIKRRARSSSKLATKSARQQNIRKSVKVKKQDLRRMRALRKETATHKKLTQDLMQRSEAIGKKMMLAVQGIESNPPAGKK